MVSDFPAPSEGALSFFSGIGVKFFANGVEEGFFLPAGETDLEDVFVCDDAVLPLLPLLPLLLVLLSLSLSESLPLSLLDEDSSFFVVVDFAAETGAGLVEGAGTAATSFGGSTVVFVSSIN